MKIRWGILGPGHIAKQFVEDFKEVKEGVITAVASRSKKKAEEFARQYSIKTAYGSYEELARDENVDVIYIAVPHTGHFANSMLCLKNGKHILCEKPLTVNSRQFEKLYSLAKEKDLFFMEAMWMYFLPPVVKVKEWLEKEEVGDIQYIQADFGLKLNADPTGRVLNPALAGGALLDLGVYTIAFSILAARSGINSIQAAAHIGHTGVDEYNSVLLTCENGIVSRLSSSVRHPMENKAIICGTKGRIIVEDFWMTRRVVLETDRKKEVFSDFRSTVGYNFEADEVNKQLLAGNKESSLMPLSASREFIRVMDEVRSQIGLVYPFE